MALNVVEILVTAKNETGKAFAEADAEANAFTDTITRIGMIGVTAIGAIGVASVVMAAKFQSSMEMLVTEAGVPQSALKGLEAGVLSLAGQVGFSPDSLSAALYHVASSFASTGISGSRMMDILKVAAEGARIGGADLVDVTNALDAAIVSGIPGVQNYKQAMGALLAIIGSGDMTMQNLAEAFGSGVIAVIKGYGLSLADAGAALAVFGDNNIRGAHAGTQLRMSVQALAVPAAAGIKILAGLGMGAKQLADDMEHGGLLPALKDLQAHFKKAGITAKTEGGYITEIFGKRAGAGLAVLMEQLTRLESKYPAIEKAAGNFGGAWAKTQGTLAQQYHELVSWAEALVTEIGLKLLPVVSEFAGFLLRNKTAITELLQYTGLLVAGLAAYALAAKAAAVAQAVWNAVMAIFTAEADANPVGIIVLAIAALIAGLIMAYKHLTWFRDAVDWVGRALKAGFEAALHAAGEVVSWFVHGPLVWIKEQIAIVAAWWRAHSEEIRQVWRAVWAAIQTDLAVTIGIIKLVIAGFIDFVVPLLRAGWAVVWGATKMAWHLIAGVIHAAIQFITGVIGIALDIITGHWSKAGHDLRTLTSNMFRDVISIIRNLTSDFGSLLYNAGKALIGGLIHGIQSMFGSIGSVVGSVASKVAGFFGLSPAREGPLSGGGAPEIRGRHYAEDLARGMLSGQAAVAAAGRHLALMSGGAMGPGGYGGGGYGTGGGRLEIILRAEASDPLMREILRGLRYEIRAGSGGGPDSVQRFLGRVA